jgi:hypothetical protein
VVEKLVRVEMAENGTSMKATHVCMKTYFLKNRSGEVVSLTVPALYVKSVNQDLLSGKACNKIGVRIILDEDPDISGLYPLDKEKQQHLEESIPFISGLWFSAATNGTNCRNATYKRRIRNTPYGLLYGEKKDLSKCRPFGCRGYMHLTQALHENISELGCAHREHSMCTPCTLCTLCTSCAHRPSDSPRPKLYF